MLHYCLYRHCVDSRYGCLADAVVTNDSGWENEDLDFESCSDDDTQSRTSAPSQKAHAKENDGRELEAICDEPSTPLFEPLDKDDEVTEGRAHMDSRGMRLLKFGEIMVIPPPRAVIPRTRDIVEEEQKQLEQLGTAPAGISARLWLQSRALRDDMLYFRAAQPLGASIHFVDFIRWHSPKDYIGPNFDDKSLTMAEREARRAEAALLPLENLLSERMAGSGTNLAHNMWLTLWEETGREGASLTEPFHPEAEAKRILAWLADAPTPEDILLHFVIDNAVSALHRMGCHPFIMGPHGGILRAYLQGIISGIAQTAGKLLLATSNNTFETHGDVEGIKRLANGLMKHVQDAELLVTSALSIHHLLIDGHHASSSDTLEDLEAAIGEVTLSGWQQESTGVGKASSGATLQSNTFWSLIVPIIPPTSRPEEVHFALRCLAERPMNTEPSLQRLVATVDSQGTWRVAISLTEEVV